MVTTVFFKKLSDLAKEPTKGSEHAAGWDLYAATADPVQIEPGQMKKIPTDIAVELPVYAFGAVYPRSGIATKRGLRLANDVGIIDADYRGNVIVALYNDSSETQTVTPQERIAQMIVSPYINISFKEVEELETTRRGKGGFGSSGTN